MTKKAVELGTRGILVVNLVVLLALGVEATSGVEKFDSRMAVENSEVISNGVKWIDGRVLPLEGRAFEDTATYFERLPKNVTTNVNEGVRNMKSYTAGMMFRFSTDSKKLYFRWVPSNRFLAFDHMAASGVSGIDIYRFDAATGKWRYCKTGRITSFDGGSVDVDWVPNTPCLVNLPLYNGLKSFMLGIDEKATIKPLPPRKSGVLKPVVFYGTSITHGCSASRPGMSFVNIIGRNYDWPVVNLGFSGSGRMELEMSEHLAKIDASCYVLDCIWNMGPELIKANYEKCIRNLRWLRPDTPIVMTERADVYEGEQFKEHNRLCAEIYKKLKAEGWKKLIYLKADDIYFHDGEGTVDGVHPNDWGMMAWAKAYGEAIKIALDSGKDK